MSDREIMNAKQGISGVKKTGPQRQFSTGAVRDNGTGKGVPSQLPTKALRLAAKRFEDGASSYGAYNFRKGMPIGSIIDSLNRHLWAYQENDPNDEETLEQHLGAIVWNALVLANTHLEIEDGTLPQELQDLYDHG